MPKEGIEIPDLTQFDKRTLRKLKLKSPADAVKYIVDNLKVSRIDAKYITTHINTEYGHCNRCIFDGLDTEYINCPQCGALNFNWKIQDEI